METTKNLREVVGYQTMKGTYKADNGKEYEYDNVHLFYLEDVGRNGNGRKGGFIKVKRSKLPLPLDQYIYCKIKKVLYDEHQNVELIEFEG